MRHHLPKLVGWLIVGLLGGFFWGLTYALTFSEPSWLLDGPIVGGSMGVLLGMFSVLDAGWSHGVLNKQSHSTPNEGILRSIRNGLRIALPLSVCLGLVYALFFIVIDGPDTGLLYGILEGIS